MITAADLQTVDLFDGIGDLGVWLEVVQEEMQVDLETMAQSAPRATAAPETDEEVVAETAAEAPAGVRSSTELLESLLGSSADAPLCMNCGTKMRPAGSCFVCEGCGSTSGCS